MIEERASATRTTPGVVNNVVYEGGGRLVENEGLAQTFEALESHPHALAWIGLYRPDESLMSALAAQFGLHPLAIEDALTAHQRPKVERYGDTRFMVLKAAHYDDEAESISFGELHVFSGPRFVITVRHAESPRLTPVRERIESTPGALAEGAEAVVYAILDAVVDGYAPVVKGLANDIDEIETQVFDGDPEVSRRIYQLNREVIEFERAVSPLVEILDVLSAGFVDGSVSDELQQSLRDVADHVVQAKERIDEFRVLLRDILQVNNNLVTQRQNEEAQRLSAASNRQAEEARLISGWAAILFAPSLVGSIYGMNFRFMPELDQPWGYPFALVLMAASSVTLFAVFKRRGWL
ncbi:magnesium and cobalt transport protein CorA [Homoserinibacter sp. YIM 151385]|uniref:magnesium and cobalt transport protein CorA n=1 Tax=Homoserinibacter sp. YIM 151385 TaxID=2985506 RepID=UPI0022F0BC90|nr:magnesium and cobalt transport protein CorA [Homoserinibacter sp. YIM 151385]WBU39215.1 magnesium and cobalt transport protein CorA [Homoserinibacter sp. YIM 151385]